MITTVSSTDALWTALKAAHAGDTILLGAGTYSALSLTGFNFAGTVTIQSADPAHQAVIKTLTMNNSSGIAFNNIEFVANGSTAVTMYSSHDISFDHAKIDNGAVAGGNGMLIRDSHHVSVTNSDLGKLGTGINELNTQNLTVSNNVFHDIQSGAIRGSGDTYETISGNQFVDAKATVADHSDVIQLWQDNTANHVAVTGNTYGATVAPPVVVAPVVAPPVVVPPPVVTAPTPPTGSVTVANSAALATALKAAHAGDTILLAAGTYSAASLSGLNFSSAVTIQSADFAHQAVMNGLTVTNSTGLSFNHIDFSASGGTGVTVASSQNIAFDAVKEHGALLGDGNGMMIRDSSGVSVTNSDIGKLYTGINELNSTKLTLTNNTFHDIQSGAIRGAGDTYETISGNQFLDGKASVADHSDVIQLWQDNTANHVTITGNTYGVVSTAPVVTTPPPTTTTPTATTPTTTTTTTPTTTTTSTAHTVTVTNTTDLMSALKAAHAGDIIQLAAGNYGAVSLYGVNFGGTVTVESADNAHQAVLTSLSLNTTSGLAFDHLNVAMTGDTNGVTVSNSSNIDLTALKISGTPDAAGVNQGVAVFIRDSSGVSVTGSEITQVGSGIGHLDSTHLTFANNNLHNLQTDGIYGGGSSDVVVAGNHFTDFHPAVGDHPDAIQFWAASNGTPGHDVTISDNVITRGNGDPIQGIFIENTQNLSITGNAMTGTMYNGIALSTATNVVVQNNFVQGDVDMGSRIIVRDGSINVTVAGNTISEAVVNLQQANSAANVNFVLGSNTTVPNAAIGDVSYLNTWASQHGGVAVVGTAGNDLMAGGAGNDLLVSWGGIDTMTGGAGADTFSFQSVPSGVSQITDFVHGQDTLDLHFLLNNYGGNTPVADQWVKFQSDSSGTTVYVDADGPSGAGAFVAVAKLAGVTSIASSDWIFH